MVRLCYAAFLIAWGACAPFSAQAQSVPFQIDTAVLHSEAVRKATLRASVAALDAEEPERAVAALEPVFGDEPAFRASPYGSVAYWLGRAYAEADRPDRAFATWARGREALDEAGAFDARLADAFIRGVFDRRDVARYREATEAYLNLIAHAEGTPPASERAVFDEHLRALALVLPDDVREQTGLAPTDEDDSSDEAPRTLKPGASATLVAWWRQQDPAPATRENERVEEHLQRWLYAKANYQREARFDARGRTYLRLGAPYKKTSVGFDDSNFRRRVLNRNPTMTAFGYPRNEFWIYPHIGYAAHYLFVRERRDWYVEADPSDLVPSTLRMGFSNSERGQRKGEAYIRSMNEVYRQLALYHIDYSSVYEQAASYVDLLEMQAFAGRQLSFSQESPAVAAQRLLSRSRTEAYRLKRRRREDVPNVYAGPVGESAPLPVEVRVARFLDEDGATRPEVYWSAPASALRPPREVVKRLDREETGFPERYFLSVALTKQVGDSEARTVARKRVLVNAPGGSGLLSPQTYRLPADTARVRIGVQWDEYVVYPDAPDAEQGAAPRLGPHLRRATFHADSLAPLNRDEGVLEMSDLKPLYLHSSVTPSPETLAQAPPYPFSRIAPGTALALYFEVYHLTFGAEDEARYTVEYDVARQAQPGGLARLFRQGEEQRTTTRTAYTAQSRTAREYILIDLDDAERRSGTLTITVRVTDEASGQTVERAVSFEVVPPAEDEAEDAE